VLDALKGAVEKEILVVVISQCEWARVRSLNQLVWPRMSCEAEGNASTSRAIRSRIARGTYRADYSQAGSPTSTPCTPKVEHYSASVCPPQTTSAASSRLASPRTSIIYSPILLCQ
jgi:hypothetical protein